MKLNLIVASLIAALVLSLGLLGKIGWTNYQLKNRTKTLNSELQKANLEKGQALTLIGDANGMVSKLEEELQDSVKDLGLQVTRYIELEAKYKVLRKKRGNATVEYYPGPPIEVGCTGFELTRGLYYEALTDKTLIKVQSIVGRYKDHRLQAKCIFVPRPNRSRLLPFLLSYSLEMKFKAQLIETISKTGAINHFVNIYEVTPEGNKKFKLSHFEVVVQDERAPRFHWWAPHLDVGGLGLITIPGAKFKPGASLGVSFMGYGRTENDLSWRFPRLSLDISDEPAIGFSPVLYNVGGPLPLVSDLWLSPHIGWMFPEGGYAGLLISSVL